MIPVRDRAQSSPVQPDGQTGQNRRLTVLDWTGSVWTGPYRWRNGKIRFSPPPPLSLARGSRWGAYRDTGIAEMDWATGSIYLGDPRVDRHHLIKQRTTHCIFLSSWSHALLPSFHRSTQFVWFLKHSCRAFIDPRNLCGSSPPGSLSHPLNLFLCSSSQNRSFSRTWLLLYDTIQWLSVWLTLSDIGLIPSEWTGPVPVRTSPVEIWTGPIPVQKSLRLDCTKPRPVQSGLVYHRTGRIIDDCWLCILGNLSGDWLQPFINEVLAVFWVKNNSNMLPAPSWKWTSTEHQQRVNTVSIEFQQFLVL